MKPVNDPKFIDDGKFLSTEELRLVHTLIYWLAWTPGSHETRLRKLREKLDEHFGDDRAHLHEKVSG